MEKSSLLPDLPPAYEGTVMPSSAPVLGPAPVSAPVSGPVTSTSTSIAPTRVPLPLQLPILNSLRGRRIVLASASPRRKQLLSQARSLFFFPSFPIPFPLPSNHTNHAIDK